MQSGSKILITAIGIITTVIVGFVDAFTGSEISFSILYLVPVTFVTWFSGKKSGIIMAVVGVAAWVAADSISGIVYSNLVIHLWNALSRLGIFLIIVYLESSLKERQLYLEHDVQAKELNLSLEKIEHKRTFQSVKRLSLFPELNPNPIIEIDVNKNLTYCNQAADAFLNRLNFTADYSIFFPEDMGSVIDALSDPEKNVIHREKKVGDVVLEEYIYVIHSFKVIQIYAMDITERKKAEEKIKRSLEEKEVLLKEIHHRVKNNLQIISSLLRLQSGLIKDKDANSVFQETQKRINSIAGIHKMLYEKGEITDIKAAEFFGQLTSMLYHLYNVNSNRIKMDVSADGIILNTDIVHPLGLLITEIISNSFKYAFPNGSDGKIFIKMNKSGTDFYELEVGDTGIGIPEGIETKQSPTLGLKLIDLLSQQISSTYGLDKSSGTKYSFKFKTIGMAKQDAASLSP